MRFGAFAFRPRIVPSVAAALAIALLVWLGNWQAGRAGEKLALQATFEARGREPAIRLTGPDTTAEALLYRRVRVAGEWIAGGQVFIDNRIHEGKAGFHVVTPLRIEGADRAVLVNRGWIERTRDYPRAPAVAVPAGRVEIEGMATVPPRRVLELSPETVSGNVWQNLSIERYATAFKMKLVPVIVLADAVPTGLARVTEQPDAGVDKHREYSLTWYSLAVTVLVLWIVLNVRRVR